jgi:hypothetical protein
MALDRETPEARTMTMRVLAVWLLLGCIGAAIEVWLIAAGRCRAMTAEQLREQPFAVTFATLALCVLSGPISLGVMAGGLRREERPLEDVEWHDREFARARRRMIGCQHARTVKVDYGMGPVTDKCVRCWAFRLPDGRWTPNSAPPPETDR